MGVRDLAPRRVGLAATTGAAAVVVAGAGAQWLGRSAGSTRQERGRPLRGDGIVERPTVVTDHAVSIAVPAAVVWPWLTQVGWHLGGWYTPRWVDRLLFPANTPSADRLDPALVRDLRVGDTIPDGPPGTAYFTVAEVAPPHLLVLHSTTHLPPGWGERLGAAIDWTWTFALEPEGEGCRVHLRVRGRTAPWWLTAGTLRSWSRPTTSWRWACSRDSGSGPSARADAGRRGPCATRSWHWPTRPPTGRWSSARTATVSPTRLTRSSSSRRPPTRPAPW